MKKILLSIVTVLVMGNTVTQAQSLMEMAAWGGKGVSAAVSISRQTQSRNQTRLNRELSFLNASISTSAKIDTLSHFQEIVSRMDESYSKFKKIEMKSISGVVVDPRYRLPFPMNTSLSVDKSAIQMETYKWKHNLFMQGGNE